MGPEDKKVFLSMVDRIDDLLTKHLDTDTVDSDASPAGRVPDYQSFVASVSSDSLLSSDAKLFCMAFGFHEQKCEAAYRKTRPEKLTDQDVGAYQKLKMLTHLEQRMPEEMRKLLGFLRERRNSNDKDKA